jgi:uncharacterized protein YkwD
MPVPAIVKRRRLVRAAAAVLGAALIAAVTVRLYLNRNAPPSPEQMAGASEPEIQILQQVNAQRARRNLKPLKFSPRLAVVARGHSYDMAIRHYHDLKSPEGSTPSDRVRGVGVESRSVAENIFVDAYRKLDGLAERALDGWIKNAEHRGNLLSPDFGIGIARSSDGSTYVTEDFVR